MFECFLQALKSLQFPPLFSSCRKSALFCIAISTVVINAVTISTATIITVTSTVTLFAGFVKAENHAGGLPPLFQPASSSSTIEFISATNLTSSNDKNVNEESSHTDIPTTFRRQSVTDSTLAGNPIRFTFPSEVHHNNDSLNALWEKTLPRQKSKTLTTVDKTATQNSIEIPDGGELHAKLHLPLQPKKSPSISTPSISVPSTSIRPAITIVIDDLGYNRQGMTASLALPTEVVLAILPNTPFSQATAKASLQQGRTIILHAPMENTRQLALGPGGLYTHMDEAEFKQVLQQSIDSLPGISGVNNHMGSLLTQDEESMRWVMETIKPQKLFFLDSVTSGKSVAYQQAKAMNITSVKRSVFLDNVQNEEAIHKQFERLIYIAKKEGRALAIGHPYPSTMQYLLKRLPLLKQEGIELISINEYIELDDIYFSRPTVAR
ncbi:divergent polysaccharide deacetylase family protein [Marinomonas agarivorans]|nr:divergent polysaccharide deacetylase family protein [Marinomonas agarivorans]